MLTTSKWMWRVDLHHHRQAYETWAPLFVLRHRKKSHDGPSATAMGGWLLYSLALSVRSRSVMKRTTASDQPSTCSHLP